MFSPTSSSVIVVLLLACAALLVGVVRSRHWALKSAAGVGVVMLAMSTGILVVNDYYGYYTSWTEAYQGTFGDQPAPLPQAASGAGYDQDPGRTGATTSADGRLVSVEFSGPESHINRPGLVYLPPQYGLPQYRAVRFPVVELLHGTPGSPTNWSVQLDIKRTIDTLMAQRAIGPMVFVMPDISAGRSEQECLDYGRVRDDTYVSHDVVADVEQRFRVSRDRSQWAAVGYSSGGYCAVNLALRHRHDYGAVASMDGYYWPGDGPAIKRLAGDTVAQQDNDPLDIVDSLRTGTAPLPQFWISAGTGSRDDYDSARRFVAAVSRFEAVTFVAQPGAQHNFYAWRDQVPGALRWVWTAIAPPALRVDFPTGGPVRTGQVHRDLRASTRPVREHQFAPAPKGATPSLRLPAPVLWP